MKTDFQAIGGLATCFVEKSESDFKLFGLEYIIIHLSRRVINFFSQLFILTMMFFSEIIRYFIQTSKF